MDGWLGGWIVGKIDAQVGGRVLRQIGRGMDGGER